MPFSRFQIFRAALVIFLCGVAVGYIYFFDLVDATALILVAGGLLIFWRRQRGIVIAACFALIFFVGVVRVLVFAAPIIAPQGQPVIIYGSISGEPTNSRTLQKIVLDVRDEHTDANRGSVTLSIPLDPSLYAGQMLRVHCSSLYFSFGRLVLRQSLPICGQPRVLEVTQSFAPSALIFSVRRFLVSQIDAALRSPASDLLSGLLIGTGGSFSKDVAKTFRDAGLTHLVAVSGYNISLVMSGLWVIACACGISRKKSMIILLAGMFCFVFLTGASSATIRAACMGALVVIAQYTGRLARGGHSLLVASAIMVAVNPSILLLNISFQLSVAATAGLIYFSPPIASFFERFPPLFGLKEIAIQTFSATVFTAPLLLWAFHGFSLVGIFSNIVILPLIPISTIAGFVWLFSAIFLNSVGHLTGVSLQPIIDVLALPLGHVLIFIIHSAQFFSSLPFAYQQISQTSFGLDALIALYAVLCVVTFFLRRKALASLS